MLAALAACGGSPPLFLSDGRQTTQVQCPAGGDGDSCAQQAQARCGADGYDTIGQSVQNTTRTLVFACRAH
nr:hypothetical protein [Burkholderia sp. WAC0059]